MHSSWAYKQMSSQPRLPFPGHSRASSQCDERRGSSPAGFPSLQSESPSRQETFNFLTKVSATDPAGFEEFLIENFRTETMYKWIAIKNANLEESALSNSNDWLDSTGDFPAGNPRDFRIENAIKSFSRDNENLREKIENKKYLEPMYHVCSQLLAATASSGFSFYVVSDKGDSLHLYNPALSPWKNGSSAKSRANITPSYPVSKNNTVASHVAVTKMPIIVDDVQMDDRFPKGTAAQQSCAVSVMCFPISPAAGDLLGVVEYYRTWSGSFYTRDTYNLVQNILQWVFLAINKTGTSSGLKQQSEMGEFLLEVSKSYLDDIGDVDNIIQHIMRFAKTFVAADRCSLFLLDKESGELFSNMFDNGEEENGRTIFQQREIRFPVDQGIVGHAVRTKQIVNIPDAYADTRFNRDIDKRTGYTTESILCIPIMGGGEVYGVVEMLNKLGGGAFTMTDQNNFQMLAVFCALALRYSKIHSLLQRNQTKLSIVKELYVYHSCYAESGGDHLLGKLGSPSDLPADFDRYNFGLMSFDEKLPEMFMHMIKLLLPDEASQRCFPPLDVQARFILCVRNNYRDVYYHNWQHAMAVGHAMFCILRKNMNVFDPLERLGLMVACVCHDLDHRALSNDFLQKINHPLAILYTSSTMEQHHCETTLDILSRKGHDIFEHLDPNDKERAISLTRHAILATDLSLHFQNRPRIDQLLAKGEFDVNKSDHRMMTVSLMMTSCDINGAIKDWDVARKSVFNLQLEFWDEGDQRKEHGFTVWSMMDRDLKENLPEEQVGFYANVALKCYGTLGKVFPTCGEMLQLAQVNQDIWRSEAEKVRSEKEENKRKLMEEKRREEELERECRGLTVKGGLWKVDDSRTSK